MTPEFRWAVIATLLCVTNRLERRALTLVGQAVRGHCTRARAIAVERANELELAAEELRDIAQAMVAYEANLFHEDSSGC